MGSARKGACFVAIGLALVTAGCGSSGSGTGASTARDSTTTGSGATTTPGPAAHAPATTAPSPAEITYGEVGVPSIQAPVQSRGTKGESPTAEAATKLHISAADCEALAKLAERQTGTALRRRATPRPPLSRCRLTGPGASIDVFLDTGFAANRRYHNRIEETVQFNAEHPAGLPRPVPHVGEKAAYNSDASWIPALGSLLAVRGNRWLTVTISVARGSDREMRDQAAVLARAGFKLSAVG